MQEDILKRFGNRVRHVRKERGWSQEKLAEHTGFHRTYIGMVERGERNISLKNIEGFAKVFQLELKELLDF
ncbi:helix-turn-helix domain-containing protein [Ekhidna sp. To15]|uniref:helix-turn-helix domain-containing protein n=1 Tax=Ekhidna sp. To15 TaxID=3395267 RepID=UPI003F522DB8